MRRSRTLIVIAGVVGTLGVLAWLTLDAFGRGMCGNEVLYAVPSPSGEHRAVVYQRDCGATTGFSTQVSVLPERTRLPNEPGNVFVADTDHGRAPAGEGGGPIVRVEWLGERHLRLVHHPAARVFRAEPARGAVRVDRRTEQAPPRTGFVPRPHDDARPE